MNRVFGDRYFRQLIAVTLWLIGLVVLITAVRITFGGDVGLGVLIALMVRPFWKLSEKLGMEPWPFGD